MILTVLVAVSLVMAMIPAYFFTWNQFRFRRLPGVRDTAERSKSSRDEAGQLPTISVLIPARNEAESIGPCLEAVLANQGVDLEVIVLDDDSEDDTAAVVRAWSARDGRVKLNSAETLPPGWCGKQFACHQLAQLATHDYFVFLDADVRLSPDALVRMTRAFETRGVALWSGFPRQITGSIAEQLLIPLIHFVLLGFLSLRRMRLSKRPAFAAGCGQLMMTERSAYQQAGGHAAIRQSLHDGLQLPRAYRRQDLRTDIFDATDVATCRMYHDATEVWQGLKKNATEGVASPRLIMPVTAMLVCGQILPFMLLPMAMLRDNVPSYLMWLSTAAVALAWLPRWFAAWRYRQSWLGACLHPIGIGLFLAIQWNALVSSMSRRKVAWKGRPYPA